MYLYNHTRDCCNDDTLNKALLLDVDIFSASSRRVYASVNLSGPGKSGRDSVKLSRADKRAECPGAGLRVSPNAVAGEHENTGAQALQLPIFTLLMYICPHR